jgi:hypothetical protein
LMSAASRQTEVLGHGVVNIGKANGIVVCIEKQQRHVDGRNPGKCEAPLREHLIRPGQTAARLEEGGKVFVASNAHGKAGL